MSGRVPEFHTSHDKNERVLREKLIKKIKTPSCETEYTPQNCDRLWNWPVVVNNKQFSLRNTVCDDGIVS